MRVINIDVIYKDEKIQLRIDIVCEDISDSDDDELDSYFEDLRMLVDLESLALITLKANEQLIQYNEALKYSLTLNRDTPISFKKTIQSMNSLTYFDVSHKDNEIESHKKKIKPHKHHIAIYTITPSISYVINLFTCLTIYFENGCAPDFNIIATLSDNFEQRLSNNDYLIENVISKSEAILTLFNKIIAIGEKINDLVYQPFINSLKDLKDHYLEQKNYDKNYTLLDYVNQNKGFLALKQKFPDLLELINMDFTNNQQITLSKIKSFKEIFSSYPNIKPLQLINSCLFIFYDDSSFKNNLIESVSGKSWNMWQNKNTRTKNPPSPAILIIKSGEFIFNDDSTIKINFTNNPIYKKLSSMKDFHINLTNEFSNFCQKLGGTVEVNYDKNEIIFSQSCTPKLIQLGFISAELFKTYFKAYNRTSFFARTANSKKHSNLFSLLPNEILTQIVHLSEPSFIILPPCFFQHTIDHSLSNKANSTQCTV